jgi:PKD repeat protein
MKHHCSRLRSKISIALTGVLLFGVVFTKAQTADYIDKVEQLSEKLQAQILGDVQLQTNMTPAEFSEFTTYYKDTLAKYKRIEFRKLFKQGNLVEDNQEHYISAMEDYYTLLVTTFREIKKEFPQNIAEKIRSHSYASGVCNPACDNIDFERADLSAWTACWADCSAEGGGILNDFEYTTPSCYGPLSSGITQSANDPNTSSYQVSLTSAGNDPVVGAALPKVCPNGGTHSCMIGDGTNIGFGVAFLEQTFNVTTANEIYYYDYAVVLENPAGHAYYQQPNFQFTIIDQNGDTIPGCGNSLLVAGDTTGLKWGSILYQGLTVYYLPWQSAHVSLKKYLGTCVTVVVRTSDCGQGGHFGYAYFDSHCEPSTISSSSPTICGSPVTLTAPPVVGGTYSWTGPCISGSSNTQSISIACPGKYSVVIGPACTDTLDTIINAGSGSAPVADFSADTVCFGSATQFTNLTSPSGGNTYTWNFGDTPAGNSVSTNPAYTYATPGTYTVTLTSVNSGCGTDTSIPVIVKPVTKPTISAALTTACSIATKDSLIGNPTGGTFSGTGVSGANFDPSSAGVGNFYVHYNYTNVNGCNSVDSTQISVQVCTGIGNVNNTDNQVSFYPSPFSDNLTLTIGVKGAVTLSMFNMLGQNVGTWNMDKGNHTINTSSLPSGVYMLQVTTTQGILNKKVVKVD